MADYYTHFSSVLKLRNQDEAKIAMTLYETMNEERQSGEVDLHLPPSLMFQLSIQDETSLWIHDGDDCGSPDDVGAFVKRLDDVLDLDGVWVFTWADTCSRPRVDAFGGGAWVFDFDSGDDHAITTSQWVEEYTR